MRFAIPLSIFILIVGLLAYGLQLDPKKVPSPIAAVVAAPHWRH